MPKKDLATQDYLVPTCKPQVGWHHAHMMLILLYTSLVMLMVQVFTLKYGKTNIKKAQTQIIQYRFWETPSSTISYLNCICEKFLWNFSIYGNSFCVNYCIICWWPLSLLDVGFAIFQSSCLLVNCKNPWIFSKAEILQYIIDHLTWSYINYPSYDLVICLFHWNGSKQ